MLNLQIRDPLIMHNNIKHNSGKGVWVNIQDQYNYSNTSRTLTKV